MTKFVQILHNSNCNCCGRQASFTELARRPSGFGPLKSALVQKRPNTQHGSIHPLERRVSERVGSANQRRKSLQHGSESTQDASALKSFDMLVGENHNAEEIKEEIAEAVAERSMLQATESRMKGTSRDKESLLEECLALKEALCDQLYHLQLHRVHHETVEDEQRKMEVQIQELEMAHGLQAPRTGDPSQLKARILGLKCRQQEYYNVMTIQRDNVEVLKKDPRVSFTKEATIERDVFAMETRRLQKIIRRLRVLYHKVCSENNKVMRLRESIAKLKIEISKIETSIKNSKSTIARMKKDIDQAKSASIEAQKNSRTAISKAGEFESHAMVLQNMLTREKEKGSRIQKQRSALGEQIRIVKKENSDRAAQAALAAGIAAEYSAGKAGGKKAGKVGKLKDFETDDDSSVTSKDLSDVRSSPSSPATPSSQSTVNKEFDELRAKYLKKIGAATDTFVETAPGSGSPRAKPHPDIALEYGAARPRGDLEAEAKRLREQLEALQKQQSGINQWLENLTIELDDKTLKVGEYIVDVKDAKTNVKITSPDKTPEALARKKAEEEARKKREAEEAAKRAAEEAARKKREAEEAAKRAAEEEAWKKKAAEDEAKRRAEDEARRRAEDEAKQRAEDEAQKRAEDEARRRAEDEAKRRAEDEEIGKKREAEEAAKKKKDAEEAARRAADEAARRAAEEAARRAADEAARRAADEAARRAADEAARRAADEAARRAADEAARRAADEAARRAAEEAARRKKEVEDAAAKGKGKAPTAAGEAAGDGKEKFFNEEMQGTIKENIKEVLGHLEVISKTVQQKPTTSGNAESTAKDVLKKLDEPPPDKSK